MTTTYDEPAERSAFVTTIPEPRPGECLCCFLFRTLDEHSCDGGLQWAGLWRDVVAYAWLDLEETLRANGGYCDCEVLMNMHWPVREPADGGQLPPCLAEPDTCARIACSLFC